MPLDGSAPSSQPDLFLPETWTNGTSATFAPPTLTAIPTATSSRASEDGPKLPVSPLGLTIGRFGRAHVRANLSARQAEEMGSLTSGTYGQPGTISSASAALQSSLVSRLQARTDCSGSTLYNLTWKERLTPAGRSIYALRASALRTSGSVFSGWPTCRAEDAESSGARWSRGKGVFDTLTAVASLLGSGPMPSGSITKTGSAARLNPEHSRWLMGFPAGWSCYEVTATRSRRKSAPP